MAVDGPASFESWEGWLGRVVDERYRIVEFLGEGGMGAVFVAEHLKLQKQVAFKVVRQQFAGNGEIAARFAREAMATGMFEHPNVASAIDFGTLPEGGAYFVMQLVRGSCLSALLSEQRRLPWRRAVAIGAQLADALSAARAIDVVHRDLKPDNIVIQKREDGSDLVKILDFGIARSTQDSLVPPPVSGTTTPKNLTREGAVVGTPGYMAPEQAMGDRVNHAADLYALGAVLWECVAGRQLWTADDLSSLIKLQLTESVPRLRELLPAEDIPEELDNLVARLLTVSTRERPESAGAVRDALQLLLLAPSETTGAVTGAGLDSPAVDAAAGQWVDGQPGPSSTGAGQEIARERRSAPDEADRPAPEAAAEALEARDSNERTERTVTPPRRIAASRLLMLVLSVLIFVAFFVGAILYSERDPQTEVRELSAALEQAAEITPPINVDRVKPAQPGPDEALSTGAGAKEEGEAAGRPGEPTASGAQSAAAPDREPGGAPGEELPAAEPGAAAASAQGPQVTPLLLTVYVKPLMEGKTKKARVTAAKRILAHSPRDEVPAYLRVVADLQLASTCRAKKQQVLRLRELGDPRALPALLVLSRQPRRGCGARKRKDCLACLRRDLSGTVEELERGGS